MGLAGMMAMAGAMTLPQMQAAPAPPTFPVVMTRQGGASNKLRIEVAPDGTLMRCELVDVIGTRGSPISNGEALCALILKDARYKPALDADGKPVTGVVFLWGHWSKGKWLGAGSPDWDVDLAVGVNKMPADYPEMTVFHLTLFVDSTGHVEQCAVEEPRLSDKTRALLCSQAKFYEATPARDAAGMPVASVQPFRLRLASETFMDAVMEQHFPDVVAREKKEAKKKKAD